MENPFHNKCMTSKEYAKALEDDKEIECPDQAIDSIV
jgi:hypothetical protein